jgi:hypothetical protein
VQSSGPTRLVHPAQAGETAFCFPHARKDKKIFGLVPYNIPTPFDSVSYRWEKMRPAEIQRHHAAIEVRRWTAEPMG